MPTLMEVKGLTKIYGSKLNPTPVLANISFGIAQGEFIGIMGPSGAGKTTLLNLLATIDRPTTGQVLISGTDITKLKERQLSEFRKEKLGFIFQDFNLMDSLNVGDNILLPLALGNYYGPQLQERLAQVTQILGIHHLLKKMPVEISIGQKQRVAAARALITNPEIIFADEPTGSLDSKAATELLQYLTKMNQELATTILMVTHDAFAASYCQRILFIKDGAIYGELDRSGSRRAFFNKIMEMQTALGGGSSGEFN